MKTGVIIQARMGSTRFPKKAMAELMGKPLIAWVVGRVKKSKLVDVVVLATTTLNEDDTLEEIAKLQGIEAFRGSGEDVLDRYYQAAKVHRLDAIVRVTGDCPLIDPAIIDYAVKVLKEGDYCYVSNCNEPYADGFDVEAFTFSMLENAWRNAKMASEREHVTPYIRKTCDRIFRIENDARSATLHCSVDKVEDLEMVREICAGMREKGLGADFTYGQVLDYLDENPHIGKINEGHEINEGLKKSLREDREFKKM